MLTVEHKSGKFMLYDGYIVSVHLRKEEYQGIRNVQTIDTLDMTKSNKIEKMIFYSLCVITKQGIEYLVYQTENKQYAEETYDMLINLINYDHEVENMIIECPEFELGVLLEDD